MRLLKTASILFVSLAVLAACNSATPSTPTPMPSGSGSTATGPWTWDGAQLTGKHEAVIKTSKGDITVELDATMAPKTVTNFMALAASGYYDNVTFHRVIPGFMIQGGDPNGTGAGGRSIFGDTFEDEIDPKNAAYHPYKKGTLAMANRGPNTNGSQFFIMHADYRLDPNYTIFGKVTKGQDVVDAIANVPRGVNDKPNEKVTFSVTPVK